MKGRPVLLVFALALPLLAGCLSSAPQGPDYGAIQDSLQAAAEGALQVVHDAGSSHFDAKAHRGSYNMQLVGYSNGVDAQNNTAALPTTAYYTELAVKDQYAYLAAASVDGAFGGLRIVDVSDPAHPKAAGAYNAQPAVDVEVDPEAHYAFLATQRNSVDQIAQGLQSTQDPRSSAPRGITVLDVQDKRHPSFLSFLPLPVNGPHTLTYYRHPNGNDYLLVCTYDLVTDPATSAIEGTVPLTQRLLVYLVQKAAPSPIPPAPSPVPATVTLVPVAQYQIADAQKPGAGQPLVFPHDARVYVDGDHVYIALAYWDKGVRVLDFTHPAEPSLPTGGTPPTAPSLPEVGAFVNFAPSRYNNIHLARPFTDAQGNALRIADKTVMVAEPEIIDAPEETGQLSFLDATDPAHMAMLGHWTLHDLAPDLAVKDLDFSPHNFDLWDGKVALAHYHAGVWVLDVHDAANLAHPKAVGFYMPTMERPNSPVKQPDVWSVVQKDGLLYASDEATGLNILRYTGP